MDEVEIGRCEIEDQYPVTLVRREKAYRHTTDTGYEMRYRTTYIVRYGKQVTHHGDVDAAVKAFGICMIHAVQCAGLV